MNATTDQIAKRVSALLAMIAQERRPFVFVMDVDGCNLVRSALAMGDPRKNIKMTAEVNRYLDELSENSPEIAKHNRPIPAKEAKP